MDFQGGYRVRQAESSFDESSKQDNLPKPSFSHTTFGYHIFLDRLMKMFLWVAFAASQVVAVICIALVSYWCVLHGGFAWASDPNLQFFVHPLCMVLGLILCYGDAIIVYRILSFLPKLILKIIHASLHFMAIILSSVGLAAVFENHRRTNRADLYSLHSWVGIATFGLFCYQYVVSFLVFLFPGLPPYLRARIMPFHTFFGVGIFILAVATAQMGLTERLLWTSGYTDGEQTAKSQSGNFLGLFLIVYAFLIVFIVTQTRYKRKPLPNEISPTN